VTVTAKEPATLGVPLITPVEESMDSPGGNVDPAE
jgi:hypothetical protein